MSERGSLETLTHSGTMRGKKTDSDVTTNHLCSDIWQIQVTVYSSTTLHKELYMKSRMLTLQVIFAVLLLGFTIASAGITSGKGNGNGEGDGPIHDFTSGEPFSFTGEIIEMGVPGNGFVLATASDNVTIFGIGPVRYWQSLGLEQPTVGETITVTGYTVNFNGTLKNIAFTITVGGIEVQLRDPETGKPMWRNFGSKVNA